MPATGVVLAWLSGERRPRFHGLGADCPRRAGRSDRTPTRTTRPARRSSAPTTLPGPLAPLHPRADPEPPSKDRSVAGAITVSGHSSHHALEGQEGGFAEDSQANAPPTRGFWREIVDPDAARTLQVSARKRGATCVLSTGRGVASRCVPSRRGLLSLPRAGDGQGSPAHFHARTVLRPSLGGRSGSFKPIGVFEPSGLRSDRGDALGALEALSGRGAAPQLPRARPAGP